MASPIRVVVACAHVAMRAGIRQALEGDGVEVCGEAVDGVNAVETVDRSGPDCCLIEVDLPDDPLVAVSEMRTRSPTTTIVVLADDPNPAELLRCVRAGADGYLPKGMNPDRLGAMVHDACSGGAAIPRRLVGTLVDAVRTSLNAPELGLPADVAGRLSRRELEILALLRQGESTGMIAASLSVSPVTVRRHVSSIVDKLGVSNRQAAIEMIATE
jgi:DNA-binding NarL/FixJ family response regulator